MSPSIVILCLLYTIGNDNFVIGRVSLVLMRSRSEDVLTNYIFMLKHNMQYVYYYYNITNLQQTLTAEGFPIYFVKRNV